MSGIGHKEIALPSGKVCILDYCLGDDREQIIIFLESFLLDEKWDPTSRLAVQKTDSFVVIEIEGKFGRSDFRIIAIDMNLARVAYRLSADQMV